ncbi:MAG: pilus assembly protein [Selenomonadaceae bacterium]|nr:pilus assembly protein [Selenomonadaceae bacterium]
MFIKINRSGQAMVLYALLMPFLFLFVGVGMDLGWYYLNVSRLQNAADAAALAGAQALVEKDKDFQDYYIASLDSNVVPEDFDNYEKVFSNTFDGTTSANGELYNYKKADEVKDTLAAGRVLAEQYARENLLDDTKVKSSTSDWSTMSAIDGWSISKDDADKKVSGSIELKYKIVDGKNDVYGPLYYVVNLKENIRHFFMPG